MNFNFILVLCLSLAIVFTTVSAGKKGKGKGKGQWKGMQNMTCKGESIEMTSMRIGKKECKEEMSSTDSTTAPVSDDNEGSDDNGSKKGDRKKWKKLNKNQCFHVCVMKKQKVLNDDGSYSSDGADTFIKSVVPESVQASLKSAYDECNTANSNDFSMDNDCKGYKKFSNCTRKKFMEICEIKGKGKNGKKGGDKDTTTTPTSNPDFENSAEEAM